MRVINVNKAGKNILSGGRGHVGREEITTGLLRMKYKWRGNLGRGVGQKRSRWRSLVKISEGMWSR